MIRFVAIGLTVISLCSFPAGLVDAMAASAQLRVTPGWVHPGGTVYVSGSGFAPSGRHTVAVMACGSGGTALQQTVQGPAPDAHMQFSGFPIRVPRGARKGQCTLTIQSTSGMGAEHGSARFTIMSSTVALPFCATHICLHLQALLMRLRNGAQGNISVTGWPGARVTITISYPNGSGKQRRLRLGWRGSGLVRLTIAPGLLKGTATRVMATARLGSSTGTATQTFTVVPGGH